MDKSKIERKLAKKIRHIIKKIKNGYETIYSYTDGCDKYNFIRFFECKNGYDGESWEIDRACDNSIKFIKLSILNYGITFNDVKYYIHSDLYYKDYFDKELVKIISYQQHIMLLETSNNIKDIISKINDQIEEYDTGNHTLNINFMLQREILYNAKKMLEYAPLHTYNDFVKYVKNNNYYYKTKDLVINIINSDKFKNERQMLGLGTELIK